MTRIAGSGAPDISDTDRSCDGAARDWIGPVAAFLAAWLCAIWMYFGQGALSPGQQGALVFPPWWREVDILQAAATANLDILDFGPLPFVLFVIPRSEGALAQARQAGAFVGLNARFAALCGAVKKGNLP